VRRHGPLTIRQFIRHVIGCIAPHHVDKIDALQAEVLDRCHRVQHARVGSCLAGMVREWQSNSSSQPSRFSAGILHTLNMPKRVHMAGTIALVILGVSLAGWCLWLPAREPRYQGKALRDWLWDYYNGGNRAAVTNALRVLGTNATPTLVGMLRSNDSALKEQLVGLWHEHIEGLHFLPLSLRYPSWYRHQAWVQCNSAAQGFEILGVEARGAIPDLIGVYRENISPVSQDSTCHALAAMGPAAREAIPWFLKSATNSTEAERKTAIWALLRFHADAPLVLPVLTICLSDTNSWFRWLGANGLASLGHQASETAPELVTLLQDPAREVRVAATNALRQVDAAAAVRAGVR